MKTLVVSALVVGAGILIYKDYSNFADQLSYEIRNLKGSLDRDLSKIRLNIGLSLINPTDKSVTFDSFSGSLSYKDSAFAKVNNLQKIEIKPRAITTINIPVVIPTINLGSTLGSALTDVFINKINPVLTLNGTVNLSAGSLKINKVQTLSIV